MKRTSIITALLLTLALAGCSNSDSEQASLPDSSDADISDIPDIPDEPVDSDSSESVDETREDATKIVGLAGDRIYESDMTSVFNIDGSTEYSDENFELVTCEGFAYLAEPSFESLNSYDNADIYDDGTLSFAGASDEKLTSYKRVNVGDTFCGLTLISADTSFGASSMDDLDKESLVEKFPGIYFNAGSCEFSGELTMTGYACIVPEDEYGVEAGTVLFVPSGNCPLPVMAYYFDSDNGIYHCMTSGMEDDLVWYNEYGSITLGNINTTSADLSDLPDDGKFVKVSVTVDSIMLSSSVNFQNVAIAEIVEINCI